MVQVVKNYGPFDLSDCPCCGVAPCSFCGNCDPGRGFSEAVITLAGFTGWAAAMNRSFSVSLGDTCSESDACELYGFWAGITGCSVIGDPPSQQAYWRRARLSITGTQYQVLFETPPAPGLGLDCAADIGVTKLAYQNSTDDYAVGECDVAYGTPTSIAWNGTTPSNVSCDGGDAVDVSGTTCTVEIISHHRIPSTLTLTFTGNCAAALGGPYTLTYSSISGLYEYQSTNCGNMLFTYDPCNGDIAGTGSGGNIGATGGGVTDWNPLTFNEVTITSTAACCSAPDAALTTAQMST